MIALLLTLAVYLVLMFFACRAFAVGERGDGPPARLNVVLSLTLIALAVWLIVGKF